MDLTSYADNASRTCSVLDRKNHDLHMVLGIVTEAGELADVFKKELAYSKEVDWVNVQEEIGDLMWYIANLCSSHGWNLEEILEANITKLRARYPGKFSVENALNRDLVTERSILEELYSVDRK